ncbi:hypothetical protein FRC09_015115 [Ceratobasidium sp. 395]|nr:hypothetical protein FRC09_015115 [Ceratobasidium sp. 395]
MPASTIVRRSSRPTKQVSYVTVTGDSSGEDYDSHVPIAISDSSEADVSSAAPLKRRRVSSSSKSSKATHPDNQAARPDDSTAYEPWHPTARHNPQRLLPYLPALLDWFEEKRDARGMPWRKLYDPDLTKDQRGQRAYEVLVSEIMLQQTQVATVIPYYNRWLDKFPTLDALAAADLPAVHALWKGLGYYRRAGFLLAAAKKVKTQYGSHIPEDISIMQKEVPGMGRYTAGAVASIAYGIKAPVQLDGNVQRLLSRALAIHANSKSKQTLDMLWGAATALVEAPAPAQDSASGNTGARPGNINQALIELGSTLTHLATPGTCSTADIEEICKACEPLPTSTHSVTRFPMKVDKKKARVETSVVCAMQWTSSKGEEWWLMTKRPATGLLAGLWEFPTLDLAPVSDKAQNTTCGISDSESERALRPAVSSTPSMILPKLLAPSSTRAKIQSSAHIGSVPHIFSHIHKTYEVVHSTIEWNEHQPPQLSAAPEPDNKKTKITKDPKTKRKRANNQDGEYVPPAQALWVLRDEVMSQNVGVGMKKVWDLVQKKRIV